MPRRVRISRDELLALFAERATAPPPEANLLLARHLQRKTFTAQDAGPPTLGPAQPLTMAFVESLVRSIGGESRAEVLTENVLAKTDRMLCWWTPPRQRQMFYNAAWFRYIRNRPPTCSSRVRRQASYPPDISAYVGRLGNLLKDHG
jgi:hypothetical protein